MRCNVIRYYLILSVIMLLFCSPCNAHIINIPRDYDYIQQGIEAAAAGDTVLVHPGVYNEHLNFEGKNITLASLFLITGDTSYISQTSIDGTGEDRIITFEGGEDSTAVVTGFSMINGYADYGGAIICQNQSSPRIVYNKLSSHMAFIGGAVFCLESDPFIESNIIKNNAAVGSDSTSGGAVFLYHSNAVIRANFIDSNYSSLNGGAISGIFYDGTIKDNRITDNRAIAYGGAISMIGSSPEISGNYICQNNSSSSGGGINCGQNSSPLIKNNRICRNTAQLCGGGIHCINRSDAIIIGNQIDSNTTLQIDGGGIWCGRNANPVLYDNEITDNTANFYGGGIATISSPIVVNNRISGNNVNYYGGGGFFCGHNDSWAYVCGNEISGNSGVLSSANGGGIFCKSNSNPLITHNLVYGNYTRKYGGGIYVTENSAAVIQFNEIFGNFAAKEGGGVYDYSTEVFLGNNLIYDNLTRQKGGGIRLESSEAVIINNVIYNNIADEKGGGIYARSSDQIIKNCIIHENSSPSGPQLKLDLCDDTVQYNNVQGGYPGTGNIDVPPAFRDPGNGNFFLMSIECGDTMNSQCIDAGSPDIYDSFLDCSFGLGTQFGDMGTYGGGDGRPSDLIIYAFPLDTPVVVISDFEFEFSGNLKNTTDQTIFTDIWIMVRVVTNGLMLGPIELWEGIQIRPYETLSFQHVIQEVPESAPTGRYQYVFYCGDYQSTVMDSSFFSFIVINPGSGADGFSGRWPLSGFSMPVAVDLSPELELYKPGCNPVQTDPVFNYPNPFNASTRISFHLNSSADVSVEVYNMLGQRVKTLLDQAMPAGSHYLTWDAAGMASGIYFLKITAGADVFTKRMTLLK
jgi:hypothetical protein